MRCPHSVARLHLLLISKLDAIAQVTDREWSKIRGLVVQPRVMRATPRRVMRASSRLFWR